MTIEVLMTPLLAEKVASQMLDRHCEARRKEAQKKDEAPGIRYDENREGRDLADRIRKHCDENFEDILGETA